MDDLVLSASWKLLIAQGAFALWALLSTWGCVLLWQAYSKVQDQRLKDAQDMYTQYHNLVEHINQTLNLLAQAQSRKK